MLLGEKSCFVLFYYKEMQGKDKIMGQRIKKPKEPKTGTIMEYLYECVCVLEETLVFVFLFCMLGIFPLFYKEQYYKIGDAKLDFFYKTSIAFIAGVLLFFLLKMGLQRIMQIRTVKVPGASKETAKHKFFFLELINKLSPLDFAIFIYGICVLLSFFFSDFKEYALKGAAGWQMGLCTQLIFIVLYFILSRQEEIRTSLLVVHLCSSFLVYLFGILHRFEIDPLGMYEGLSLEQKVEFLSTIGQATWFSGYVCATFVLGMALFFVSKKKPVRVLTGIYTMVSFSVLVTQNSDSAFIAIAGILLLLGFFSLKSIELWCRFLQVVCLMWVSFAGMGALQQMFSDRAVPLDTLSLFFSQSVFTKVMLVITMGFLLFYTGFKQRKEEKQGHLMQITKNIYRGMLVVFFVGIAALILFIYLNTKGYLMEWYGYQSTNSYLLFDYHWGSNRGSTWMITWQAFCGLPFYRKLFGVGPDSLSAYLYSVPEFSDILYSLWGNIRLTNAHNEYLNSLMCYGIVGVGAWTGVLAGGIVYFYRKAKENSYMIAFALCIMGYACHNIFCYQQVCMTPFLFLFLGIGESLTKSENFNTIKEAHKS